MDWLHFYWEWLRLSFSMPYSIAEGIGFILAIIAGLLIWRRPKWESGMKHILWIIPASILVIGLIIGAAVAPYDIYKNQQIEIDYLEEELTEVQTTLEQEREQHRPILVIDVEDVSIERDEDNQRVHIKMKTIIKNIGDRPAYRTRFRQCVAPLKMPSNISSYPDLHETNPIYTGIPLHVPFDYWMSYIKTNSDSYSVPSEIVVIYTHLRYSDTSDGEYWYEQPFWLAIHLNMQAVLSATPEHQNTVEPFVNDFYEEQNNYE